MQVFLVDLKNKPGELARAAEAIAAKGIDISAISGATCGDSGRAAIITRYCTEPVAARTYQPRISASISKAHDVARSAGH